MGNFVLVLAAFVPWVFIITSNQDNVHLAGAITWAVALFGLFWDPEGYGWKLVIFWLVFGMPIAFYYTVLLFIFFSLVKECILQNLVLTHQENGLGEK